MRRIEKQRPETRGLCSEDGGQKRMIRSQMSEIRGQGKLQEDKKFGR
jgi:hypothetical protein